VNCGAIPENLLESEFFGHTKGAFTGATNSKKGKFALADGGTIFLDEIGTMSQALQAKLLRVLQEREFEPLGSERTQRVDVRVIAATNRDLRQMVAEGKFQEDLYYRLNVIPVHIPPLRERREDLPSLINFLLARGAQRFGAAPPRPDAEAEEILIAHDWPGNVRELENVLQRATILAEGECITVADLPPQLTPAAAPPLAAIASGSDAVVASASSGLPLREQVRRFEHAMIRQAIDDCHGDRRAAAQKLCIGLSSLYRKLEELGGDDPVA
jgi:two-component system response regulator AtoC